MPPEAILHSEFVWRFFHETHTRECHHLVDHIVIDPRTSHRDLKVSRGAVTSAFRPLDARAELTSPLSVESFANMPIEAGISLPLFLSHRFLYFPFQTSRVPAFMTSYCQRLESLKLKDFPPAALKKPTTTVASINHLFL
jgi:hypothetical protein